MTHAETILATLDRHLGSRVGLTLFGRAALNLGFDHAPAEYGRSLDVDGVLQDGEAEELLSHTDFWSAVEATNRELAPSGLYISHFFAAILAGARVPDIPEIREQFDLCSKEFS